MEVQLTADQKAFIREAVESGRLGREEDAVREAMALWEERERRRLQILSAVDRAEASLNAGHGRRIASADQSTKLADDVRLRGLAQLSAQQKSR